MNSRTTTGPPSSGPGSPFEQQLRDINQALLLSSIRQHKLAELAREGAEAASQLAAIVASSDDAIMSEDCNGIVSSWNRGAEVLFGYAAHEVIGQPSSMLIPEDLHKQYRMQAATAGDRSSQYESVRTSKDGRRIQVSTTVSPLLDAQGKVVGASKIIRDITARKRSESLLEAQRQILEMGANGCPLQEILEYVVVAVRQFSDGVARASLFLLEPDGLHLSFVAAAGMPATYTDVVNHFPVQCDSPSCGLAAFTHRPVIVSDVLTDPLWTPYLQLAADHDIRAVWSLPLQRLGGSVLGTLAMYHSTPKEPAPGELGGMSLLGQTAALVIERNRELEKREEVEKSLRESELRYRRLFESSRDGIMLLHMPTGTLFDANPAFCALLESTLDELRGKALWEIGLVITAAEVQHSLTELFKSGYIRFDDLAIRTSQGGMRHVEFVSSEYLEGTSSIIQCNIRDITERKRLADERERLLESLRLAHLASEGANRTKDVFLATLSHELRTPLSAILGWATMLKSGGKCTGAVSEGLAVIERNARIQGKLIDDVLDVARIVSGKFKMASKPCEVSSLTRAVFDSALPAAAEKKIEMDIQLESTETDGGLWILGDSARLHQVFWNLLNNSIKFTPSGGRVTTSVARVGDRVRIVVADTGAGIPADFLPHVFDRFKQEDEGAARSYRGLGLGLSIVHQIVELHGGTVKAESEGKGLGSQFTVEFPLTEKSASVSEVAVSSQEDKVADLVGLRALVVDDESDARTLTMRMLVAAGAVAIPASSAAEAFPLVAKASPPFDVLICDIGMPREDGYSFIRRLRAAGISERMLPALALTAFASPIDKQRALLAGFQVHVAKPMDPQELIAAVASLADQIR